MASRTPTLGKSWSLNEILPLKLLERMILKRLSCLTGLPLLRTCLLASVMLGLVACPEQPKPDYHLVSVLPAPVTPGDVVTAFGIFPAGAKVSLAGSPIATVAVPHGLQLTIPKTVLAGDIALEVEGDGVKLPGTVSVNPRVDSISLSDLEVRLTGVGWSLQDVSTVQVRVADLLLTPSLSGSDLLVRLPSALAYGSTSVSIKVGTRSSAVKSFGYQAASASGMVEFPGIPATLKFPDAATRVRTVPNATSDAILIQHTFPLESDPAFQTITASAIERSSLPELQTTRLRFKDNATAKIVLEQMQTWRAASSAIQAGVSSLEWDTPVQLADASQMIPTSLTPRDTALPGVGQWHLALEGIQTAWTRSKGQGITVAVVDTGVALEHPDLKANLLPGYDFVDDDNTPQDIAGHGTHVAGLIAANGLALGVAPLAKILPIRALRDLSGGSSYDVATGMLWAANLLENHPNPNPAQIVNLSLGSDTLASVIEAAVNKISAAGVLIVAATGNTGSALAYPAALPQVIAVTALAGPTGAGLSYQPAYANRGRGVWVTAYGGDLNQDQNHDGVPDGILSTDIAVSGYGLRMGTSMAAPQVAGLLALALASGTPSSLARSTLAATTTDLGVRGYDLNFGYGLISGRIATTSTQRSYVLAADSQNVLRAFALVQDDGSYSLNNLPPNIALTLFAASDANNNGILAEPGELRSSDTNLTPIAGNLSSLPNFVLNPTDGHAVFALAR
jgi:serine protease